MRAVRRTRFTCGVAAVVVGSSLLLPDAASAVPPSNDDFDAAIAYTIPTGPMSGTTVEATSESGEPTAPSPATVWYRVTALRKMYAGICVVSAAGAVAEPFTGLTVSVVGPPGVEITPSVNAPLYKDLSTTNTCPGGSAPMRFYSFNGAGDRMVRVTTATPGTFTVYVVDGYAKIECADSAKMLKQYKKQVAQAKKRVRTALQNHAAANVVKKLKKDLARLKKKQKVEIEFHAEVCSYVS